MTPLTGLEREYRFWYRVICAAALVCPLAACATETELPWAVGEVSEPTLFAPGVITSRDRDYGITFSQDGATAYFTRRPRRGPSMIMESRYVDGAWSEPEPAPFAIEGDEMPFATGTGDVLFMSCRARPVDRDQSENLWRATPDESGWGLPEPVEGTVNRPRVEAEPYSLGSETSPTLTPDGSLLYAARLEADWGWDLYVADRVGEGFGEARPLRLNTYGDETNPVMSADGTHIIYQRYGALSGPGEQDLYVARRTDHGWSDPWPLPEPINSDRNDGWPAFSPDGEYFLWSSDREGPGGMYDVYFVSVSALQLPQP